MPSAIFFDLDDTIILFLVPSKTALENAIRGNIKDAGRFTPDEVYKAIRASADWYWGDSSRSHAGRLDLRTARRNIIRLAFAGLKRNDFDLSDRIADAYGDERDSSGVLAPGAIETLENLRERGMRLALITNGASDMQRAKINQFNLAQYFDNILVEGEFECGKPDERVFKHTLERLDVSSADAWMVGDDLEYDISACRGLGIYALWVNAKGDGLPANNGVQPDKIIRRISEIPELL